MRKTFLVLALLLSFRDSFGQKTIKQQSIALLKQAKALDDEGKIQQAIGLYAKAIQLDGTSKEAYLRRGNDFLTISRYQQALEDYTKMLQLAPKDAEGYNMRAIANYRLQKNDDALSDYGNAITLGDFDALTNRGVLYLDLNKLDLAAADFTKAIEWKPDLAGDAYFNLADLQLSLQQYDAALINIRKATQIKPKSALYHAMHAKVLLHLKKDADGLAAAEQVLASEALNRDGLIYKATALSNLKRFDEAIEAVNTGIKNYPEFYLMYQLRAFIYRQMGKGDLANLDEAKAKQLGTEN